MRQTGAGRRAIFVGLGCLLFVAAWYAASLRTNRLALASPGATLAALVAMARTGDFWAQFGLSFERMIVSILAGAAVGFLLGVAAGLSRDFKHVLEPFRWAATSIPPVTVLVLAMLWLGIGAAVANARTNLDVPTLTRGCSSAWPWWRSSSTCFCGPCSTGCCAGGNRHDACPTLRW